MSLDELFEDLVKALVAGRFAKAYSDEGAVEEEVWNLVRARCAEHFGQERLSQTVLTSHAARSGRSVEEWRRFLRSGKGPDVNLLGSNNRLDIVVRHPGGGTIGIEVKSLSAKGHARKLTQGLGQVVISLAARQRAMLVIHCGAVPRKQREALRAVAPEICGDPRLQMIVVP